MTGIRRHLNLVWVLVVMQAFVLAQSSSQPSSTAGDTNDTARQAPATALSAIAGMQVGGAAEEDTSEALPQVPALLGGKGVSSAVLSEMTRVNYLRAGLNVGATYDDNPLLLSRGATSNTSESIFPNIRIDESSSRIRWDLAYAGGLTVNQKITAQNQGSHNLNFDSQYRLSPHVNLRIAENFSMTTGFFDSGNGVGVIGAGGPNLGLITPLATQRSSLTTIESSYHFALNDFLGGSGTFYDTQFTNVQPGTILTGSQTATGSAFWLHRLFGEDWGGLSYHLDRITFDPTGETLAHSFLVMDSISLSKRFTFDGFVGPQYLENNGLLPGGTLVVQSNQWSVAGGFEGAWRNENTGISVGYARTLSDGGGLLGPVRIQLVQGSFRRQLTKAWAGSLAASHGTNQELLAASATTATSINLTSAGFSLERSIGKSLGFRMGYTHDFQEQFGLPAPTPTLDAHRNRFFVTLSYQWSKPLGM